MENPKFIDNDLRQVFRSEDTLSVAQNINGKVFREYENRITKQFKIQDKSYFIKFHGPVGWKEIIKNLIQIYLRWYIILFNTILNRLFTK